MHTHGHSLYILNTHTHARIHIHYSTRLYTAHPSKEPIHSILQCFMSILLFNMFKCIIEQLYNKILHITSIYVRIYDCHSTVYSSKYGSVLIWQIGKFGCFWANISCINVSDWWN